MLRAPLILFTAALLLIAQIQCAAACAFPMVRADSAKSESIPPCHRHRDHSQDRVPASCAHPSVCLAAVAPQAQHADVPQFSGIGLPAVSAPDVAAEMRARVPALADSPPPGVHRLSSVVLRI
jgi:hypothetical protein